MSAKPLEFEKPIYELEAELSKLRTKSEEKGIDLDTEINALESKLDALKQDVYGDLSPWQRVQISRHTDRPFMLEYVNLAFEDFIELHGDRHVGDDHAMPAGFATIGGIKCVVVGHQKGRDTKENLKRNFGSAHPEGYRKALRVMKMAERFNLPIVAMIDTPGAFPGIGAEERNIAEAIAYNLKEMMLLKVPVIAVVLGEGGSGGALGIGIADKVVMFENAYYSVISPEGCAAILWKHRKHAPEAAEALKLVGPDLKALDLIDEVIDEPRGGAHRNHEVAADSLKEVLVRNIQELQKMSAEELLDHRYNKFRKYGEWAEA